MAKRWAARIAKFIVENRPIHTTGELTEIIKAAILQKQGDRAPPSKRTFQAIRIEVNGELEILEGAIETAVNFLESGGRLCVLLFIPWRTGCEEYFSKA